MLCGFCKARRARVAGFCSAACRARAERRSLSEDQVRTVKRLLDKRAAVKDLLAGLTLAAIAREAGTSTNVVASIERGATYKDAGNDW